jgi:hypothetical protein
MRMVQSLPGRERQVRSARHSRHLQPLLGLLTPVHAVRVQAATAGRDAPRHEVQACPSLSCPCHKGDPTGGVGEDCRSGSDSSPLSMTGGKWTISARRLNETLHLFERCRSFGSQLTCSDHAVFVPPCTESSSGRLREMMASEPG